MKHLTEKKRTFSQEMCGSPYLLFLIVIYITLLLSAIVTDSKLIVIGLGLAPGGLLIAPFGYLVEDVIAEVYGYKISRLLIWFMLLSCTLFSAVVLIIIHFPSPAFWHFQSNYNAIFDQLPRMIPSYFFGLILVSQFINIFVITKLKVFFAGRFFWIRSIFAGVLGGMIGATITFILAYGGKIPWAGMEKLFLTDYIYHILYPIFIGGPAWLLVLYLKKKENIDVYDTNTNFNPFKLSLKD